MIIKIKMLKKQMLKYQLLYQQKTIFQANAHVVEGSFKPRPRTFKKKGQKMFNISSSSTNNNNNNNNFNRPKSNYMN